MRHVYLTDGTPEGFFTAAFEAYADKDALVTSSRPFQTSLYDVFISVPPDRDKARRVLKKIGEIDRFAATEIDLILRTPAPDREQAAFAYLRLLVKTRAPVRKMLALPEVRRAAELSSQVSGERHRLTGFLRFSETASGVLYAPCSPDNDVVDLLMPHFAARLGNSPFVIHDLSRRIAGIGNGKEWLVSPVTEAEIVLSETEEIFLGLWKKYYRSVYIPARKNTRQMKGYMPVRYWKFMPETQAEEEDEPATLSSEKNSR